MLVCPACPTSDRVQSIVFADGFWTNLGIAVLPFAIVIAVTVLLARGLHA
jgi:hypothetical protein